VINRCRQVLGVLRLYAMEPKSNVQSVTFKGVNDKHPRRLCMELAAGGACVAMQVDQLQQHDLHSSSQGRPP
jgi:hypothetical protein